MSFMKHKQPYGTEEVVPISSICVPHTFKETTPKHHKLMKACKFLHDYGAVDKPLTVMPETNEDGFPPRLMLVDEYTRYLALLYNGHEKVPVKYIATETIN